MNATTAKSRPELLTINEVADALRVSTDTVRRRVGDGTIRGITLGRVIRIPAPELDRLLDDVAATRRQ